MTSKRKKGVPKEGAAEKLEGLLTKNLIHAVSGPMITTRKIFEPFIAVVRGYLKLNQYSEMARNLVATMAFHFRQEAMKRFKHDTVETIELAKEIRVPQDIERVGRLDAVSHIMAHAGEKRFTIEQQSAAEDIQKVWLAFSKGLGGSSGDLSRAGGSGRVLSPLDNMDENLWRHYNDIYLPFYREAVKIIVAKQSAGTPITMIGVILRVLIEDVYPEFLDRQYEMEPGSCLQIICRGLSNYHSPRRLIPKLKKKAPRSLAAARQDGGLGSGEGKIAPPATAPAPAPVKKAKAKRKKAPAPHKEKPGSIAKKKKN